jgi:pimeloyl-ACP methyl ester carboxylesterase
MIDALKHLAVMIAPAAILLLTAPVHAQAVQATEVTQWHIYGAPSAFERATGVPGGNAVAVDPRGEPDVPWASAAGMPVPFALRAGEHVTAAFWARSNRAARIPVTIQGGAPHYAAVVSETINLGPQWRRYVIVGVAPGALAAGSQSLAVQMGASPARVELGPVAFFERAAGDADIDRTFADFRPSQIAEDVRIESEPGITLAGTLKVPNMGDAPYPVVLLLGGGGPAPRGIYPLLEQRLLAHGIATLSYDKRGVGQSTGTLLDTIELMIKDATATVAWLRRRPEIDPMRVALFGLSQGGVVGPAVAAKDPRIAAVVMLAAPAGRQGTLFLDAMRVQLVHGGFPTEAIAGVLAATRPFMEAHTQRKSAEDVAVLRAHLIAAIVTGGRSPDEANGWADTLASPVVVSQWQTDAHPVLAAIRVPVLALYGSDDTVVAAAGTENDAANALSGNPDATVAVMAGMNHGFQRMDTGPGGKPVRAGPALSDPATLDRVTRWLSDHLVDARPPS